eukprot:9489066-Pyramimonas_sp.AAC.1
MQRDRARQRKRGDTITSSRTRKGGRGGWVVAMAEIERESVRERGGEIDRKSGIQRERERDVRLPGHGRPGLRQRADGGRHGEMRGG